MSTDISNTIIKTLILPVSSTETSNELTKRYMEREPSTLNDYNILDVLGSGGQGTVYKAVIKQSGQLIALKILKINPASKNYTNIINEIDSLEKISNPKCSPYLSCYYDHFYDPKKMIMIIEMEYIKGDTLGFYAKRLFEMEEYNRLYRHLVAITNDLVKGIKIIHDNNIIHNDIKPNNIIINSEKVPVLIDFGLACDIESKKCDVSTSGTSGLGCCKIFGGTPYYMSPESFDLVRYKESDIWSLGVTLYYSATGGKYPYDFKSFNMKEVREIIDGSNPKLLKTTNSQLNVIVNGALKKNPLDRISLSEIMKII